MDLALLTDVERVAVAKAIKLDGENENVAVGVHDIDILVRIMGTFKKSANYERTVKPTIDPWKVIAAAVASGCNIEELATAALTVDANVAKVAKAEVAKVAGESMETVETEVAGRITPKLVAKLVPEPEEVELEYTESGEAYVAMKEKVDARLKELEAEKETGKETFTIYRSN
jgi:hypothetical protein